MRLVIDHIDDTLCLVSDISAPAMMSALKRGTYLECCEYIQEHNPKDLTSKMCDALNARSGPTHMGEPVLLGEHNRLPPATPLERLKAASELPHLRAAAGISLGDMVVRVPGSNPALAVPYGVVATKQLVKQYGGALHEHMTATEALKQVDNYRANFPELYAFFQPATLTGDCPPPKEAPARSLEAHLLQVELNSTGPENPLRPRKLNRLELAALDWWRARRPVDWSSVEHVMNPTINTHTAAEAKMAAMAAELFMQACEVGQLTFEAPVQS